MNSEIVSFMQQLGIAASYLPVIYWSVVKLVIICVIYLSNVLCHGVIIPLVRQVTRKTQVDWDDTILNDNVPKNIDNFFYKRIFKFIFFIHYDKITLV